MSEVVPPAPIEPRTLGIFGGTFDPIHHGHLAIAEDVRDTLGLERVLFVTAARPPHKLDREITPAEHRQAMTELAIAGNPAFSSSRAEIDRPGPSYTVDTLAELASERGPEQLWFLLSSEALLGFPTWHEPGAILDLARLAVVRRPGSQPVGPAWVDQHFAGHEDRFRFLSAPLLPISGSVVRQRVAAGRSIRYLVPDPVVAYIAEHRLYVQPA